MGDNVDLWGTEDLSSPEKDAIAWLIDRRAAENASSTGRPRTLVVRRSDRPYDLSVSLAPALRGTTIYIDRYADDWLVSLCLDEFCRMGLIETRPSSSGRDACWAVFSDVVSNLQAK